jgi:hypothetical protein
MPIPINAQDPRKQAHGDTPRMSPSRLKRWLDGQVSPFARRPARRIRRRTGAKRPAA